jgi:hypothetical protein
VYYTVHLVSVTDDAPFICPFHAPNSPKHLLCLFQMSTISLPPQLKHLPHRRGFLNAVVEIISSKILPVMALHTAGMAATKRVAVSAEQYPPS